MRVPEVAAVIRAAPIRSAGKTKVVAIDGCGGAGKSTLAAALVGELEDARIVPTDDFASWEVPIAWAPRFLDQVLRPIARGDQVRYQRYDWDLERLGDWVTIPAPAHLVIEGVSSSRLDFAPYVDFAIWVDTDRDERLRRGLERDGRDTEALWRQWMAAEDEYVARERPRERVDLVLNGGGGSRY